MMEPWLERWQEGCIGWHEASGNAGLQRFWNASNRRVLVPLCGKSVDLLWLESQGNEVTGVELSPLAARAFFEENKIEYEFAGDGRYRAVDRAISIACADYFEFSGETFDACYDRGALVALPPSAEQLERVWTVRAAIDSLDDDEREIVRLQHLEGHTHAEIADRLGIAVGTVKSRSHRAHRRLARRLAHLDDANEVDDT